MAKFVYLYSGGQMAETPEAQEESMRVWGAWFGALGDSVADIGNPFGAGSTVTGDGATTGGASKLGGYSIVEATSLTKRPQRLMDARSWHPAAASRSMRPSPCDPSRVES